MLIKEYTLPLLLADKSFKSIYEVQQGEVDEYKFNIDDIVNQCFVDKATWGLAYWEDLLGISLSDSSTLEQRRGAIKSALIGQGTVTVEIIKDIATTFTGGDVEIKEDIEPFTFEVKFVGVKGVPQKLNDLTDRINIIKPAHLLVKYTFTYNNWDFVSRFKWVEIKSGTWNELRTR